MSANADFDQWLKQNNLSEFEDVFHEENISRMEQLRNLSFAKMSEIVYSLKKQLGPSFNQKLTDHFVNCLKNINPQISNLLHDENQQKPEPQSTQNNKILNKLETYNNAYSTSLARIKLKQQQIDAETSKLDKGMEDMFASFHNKTQNIIQEQVLQYKRSLSDNLKKQNTNFEKIKHAKQLYIDKINNTAETEMPGFNAMIENKLKKYNPDKCINDPPDLFQTLQQTQQALEVNINQQIVDLLLANCKDITYSDDHKEYKPAPVPVPCHFVSNRLYICCYVSSISQYSLDATGSCTINALEAAIQLQTKRKVSVELVDEIVNLAALYKQNKHTGVNDIFPAVTRYNNNLQQVDWMQITVKNINSIIDRMSKILQNASSTSNSVSAVLTKPPETIFIHLSDCGDIYIYDSHPRPQLNGSHFLLFNNRHCAETYLKELWPFQNLGAGFNDLRSQQINMLDVTLFQLKFGATPSKNPDLQLMGEQLSKVGVSLENKWHKNYGKHKAKTTSVNHQNPQLQVKENLYMHTRNDAFKCKMCKNDFTKESVFIYSSCNCSSCRDCAQTYVKQQFDNNKWPIKCPFCSKGCVEKDFMLCSKQVSDLYNQQTKRISNGFTEIPCPRCNNIQILNNWKTTKNSVCCPQFGCSFCACKRCYVSWTGTNGQTGHSGLTCDQVKKIINDPIHFKKCNKCSKMVQNQSDNYGKYTKCSKCKNCGQVNCFECGQSVKHGQHKCPKNKWSWDTLWNFIQY